ncbi:serine hydroxymethyltransferase [Psittacicella gerlachiana]|uniref:Serine hydroxymethyltransferase n=1 Tax=Psittacicella gerlachiana TaxID=2028574 RepID=A0A3A1Y8A3_9GAMM|nr:serine hydroxymethyltransferase [Psittacicella gerlachiana]RIY34533.1 serine hydroxymethyltransferase [Psittacicella gerlachiana]
MINPKSLQEFDAELFQAVAEEQQRQEDHIELIASENYVSELVLELQGSVLTNKYAEGYPHARYYNGCEFIDKAEELAIERAKQLFNCDYANVQPHSGSNANLAVYLALINHGDVVLGMDLDAGGHLTHGAKVSFSGKNYISYGYGVDANGYLDYDAIAKQALEVKPKVIVAGFSAYSRVVDWKRMREIADSVGAYLFCDIAHVAGLIATGLYPSPLDYAHVVTTTTHKTLAGPRGGMILSKGQSPEFYKKLNSGLFPGSQGGPLEHVIAAKAVAFKEALQPEFKEYMQRVLANAKTMVSVFQERGYKIVSGGTDNHLLLLDLLGKEYSGKQAAALLEKAWITANKNSVPGETRSPFQTSGVRFGTPAITRRGFTTEDTVELTHLICDLLDSFANPETQEQLVEQARAKVKALCAKHPVYKKA